MARKRFSREFQDQACRLVTEQGYTQIQAAKQLGITRETMHEWLKKRDLLEPAEVVEVDYDVSDDPDLLKGRIRELEKQLKRAKMEKEILKKATAYFANQNP